MHLLRLLLLVLSGMGCDMCYATHIVGGEVTYTFLGSAAGGDKYQFSLSIYEDCINGSPIAIAQDDPAYVGIYDGRKNLIYFDSANFSYSVSVPSNLNAACVTNAPPECLLKKTFIFNFVLPPDTSGYLFTYQRCCRNAAIINIEAPGASGSTYFANVPSTVVVGHNNSAVFKNYPPQIICANDPLTYDHAATDADGDSLSYELCEAYNAPDGLDRNIPPAAPPYDPVTYIHPPYSYSNPLTGAPPVSIDPITGFLTCTPQWPGRYLVTVCCSEWRHGTKINTIRREFQFVVTNCSKTVVANMPYFTTNPAIYEINCKNHTINFINTSTGATSWHWNFGQAGLSSDSSSAFQPTFVYADSGTYNVKLVANPGTPCADSIIKLVKVYPVFSTSFTDSGRYCATDTIFFKDLSLSTAGQVTKWVWNFGDGISSSEQSPFHIFPFAGTFNVMLVSGNERGCIDTLVTQVPVENFKPFAGNDTIIVKGEHLQLHATGGIEYTWIAAEHLDYVNKNNPTGYYADTGKFTYIVKVLSAYGCLGFDTVNVQVVDNATFYVPTGFSPNGDGLNDKFRPVAVGYSSLKYFRVYDRWGAEVYFTTVLNEGWDGTYNNRPAEMGTYYWEIVYTDRMGNDGHRRGDVTLVR